MIVFISCVKTKRDHRCRAEEMYISDLFKKSLAYAKKLKPDRIFILSAKYGCLELDDVIEPYEATLKQLTEADRKRWAFNVCKQLEKKQINFNEEAIFLCGVPYRKHLMRVFKNAKAPLANLGFGQQLKFYSEETT